MNRKEKIGWFFKLIWYNNVTRHTQQKNFQKTWDNDPQMRIDWYEKFPNATLTPPEWLPAPLTMQSIQYGMDLAKRIHNERFTLSPETAPES